MANINIKIESPFFSADVVMEEKKALKYLKNFYKENYRKGGIKVTTKAIEDENSN